MNINSLQQRLRENRLQQHVGEAVMGALPGAGPQYYPNPYLPHLYNQSPAATGHGHPATSDNQQDQSVAIDIDSNSLANFLDQMESRNLESLDTGTHTHSHEPGNQHEGHNHTHGNSNPVGLGFDWKHLMSSGAFLCILFLHLMADHILGLLVFVGMFLVMTFSNKRMIEIVHLASLRERETRKLYRLCIELIGILTLHIVCIYIVFFKDQELWRVLYFQLPLGWGGNVFDLFWVTMVTDYILKSIAVILKSILTMIPNCILDKKKRGRYYMFVEVFTQTYRCTAPIIPWVHFLYDKPSSGRLIFSAILVILYIVCKLVEIRNLLIQLKKAILSLLKNSSYGTHPTKEEIADRDEVCPICQDNYQDPVMLSCKHIFCENCVSVWFDREKTCPMCRTQIQSDRPTWQDGSTAQHVQWY